MTVHELIITLSANLHCVGLDSGYPKLSYTNFIL